MNAKQYYIIHLIVTFIIMVYTGLFDAQGQQFSDNKELFESALLKNGNNQGRLAIDGEKAKMVGVAYVEGNFSPDIYLRTHADYVWQYPFVQYSDEGIPVFGQKIKLTLPVAFRELEIPLALFQDDDLNVFLIAFKDKRFYMLKLNSETYSFEELHSTTVPYEISSIVSLQAYLESDCLQLIAGVPSSKHIRPPEDELSEEFYAYDGAGIYRGKINKVGLYKLQYAPDLTGECFGINLLTPSNSEVYLNFMSTSWFQKLSDKYNRLVVGSWFGVVSMYDYEVSSDILLNRQYLVNQSGDPIRHSGQGASPITYPNSSGEYSDIIVAGMGGVYYYKYTNSSFGGNLIYEEPKFVLQTESDLFTGSYATPTVYDWDGDGILDIVAGNGQGFIEFFRNKGTNDQPSFEEGVALKAGKRVIHVQPGYGESNYGPEYARNGFVGANVIDWNSDGIPDILINDGRGRHMVYMGQSRTSGEVKLRKGYPLYLKGLELRGSWRCRPGIGMLGDKMAYVTLDDDHEVHLYWRMDDYNLVDGGKLYLRSLKKITVHHFKSLGTGRVRFDLVDWDGDGKVDLLIGASSTASIPNSSSGLPFHRQGSAAIGSSVIFLKNVNNNKTPMFEDPVEIKFDDNFINLGINECSPAATILGGSENGLKNLLVGSSDGRFYLLKRNNLSN